MMMVVTVVVMTVVVMMVVVMTVVVMIFFVVMMKFQIKVVVIENCILGDTQYHEPHHDTTTPL